MSVIVIDDGAYKIAWTGGWQKIIQDQAPWVPSAASPGVCNLGDKGACVATDQTVASDFQELLDGLTGTKVPPYDRPAPQPFDWQVKVCPRS